MLITSTMTTISSLPSIQLPTNQQQFPSGKRTIWKDKKKDNNDSSCCSFVGSDQPNSKQNSGKEQLSLTSSMKYDDDNTTSFLHKKKLFSLAHAKPRHIRNDSTFSATSNFSNKDSFRIYQSSINEQLLNDDSDHTFYDEDDDDGFNVARDGTERSPSGRQQVLLHKDLWDRVKTNTIGAVGTILMNHNNDKGIITNNIEDDVVDNSTKATTMVNILQADLSYYTKIDWYKFYDKNNIDIHSYIRQRYVVVVQHKNHPLLLHKQRRKLCYYYHHHPTIELSI